MGMILLPIKFKNKTFIKFNEKIIFNLMKNKIRSYFSQLLARLVSSLFLRFTILRMRYSLLVFFLIFIVPIFSLFYFYSYSNSHLFSHESNGLHQIRSHDVHQIQLGGVLPWYHAAVRGVSSGSGVSMVRGIFIQ